MTKRAAMITILALVAGAQVQLAGCNGASPTAYVPPPTAAPPLTPLPGASWSVTRTIAEISDPSGCYLWRPQLGAALVEQLQVIRSDGSLRLVMLWDSEHPAAGHTEFAGTVTGNDFTAWSESLRTGYVTCREAVWQASVTGRFSQGGRSLVAEEVWLFRLDGGGEVKVSFDWTGQAL